MKFISGFVSIVLVSATGLACPQLAGTWECTSSDTSHDTMTIQQEPIPNGVRYQVIYESGKTQEYPADGVRHSFSDPDMTSSVLSTCLNDEELEGYIETFDQLLKLETSTDLYIKVLGPNRFMSLIQNKMKYDGSDTQESHADSDCQLTSP